MESGTISMKPRKRRLWLLLQIAGGAIAFTILFWKLPLEKSWLSVREARGWPLFIGGVSLFGVYFWTWISHLYMIRTLKRPQPMFWFLCVVLLSQVVGMFAPAKIGDLSIAWFLRKRGVAYGEGLAIGLYY
jgi:hypothetical protein